MKPIPPVFDEMEMSSRHTKMTGKELLKLTWQFQKYLLPYWDKVLLTMIITFTTVMALGVFLPFYRLFVDVAVPQKDFTVYAMWVATIGVFGFFVQPGIMSLFSGFASWVCDWYVKLTLGYRLQLMFYRHLHSLSMRFFQRRPIGEHMFRAQSDPALSLELIMSPIPRLVRVFAESSLMVAVAFSQLPTWAIVAEYVYLLLFWGIFHWTKTVQRRLVHVQKERNQAVTAGVNDGLAGFQTIKAYGRQRREVGRLFRVLSAEFRQDLKIYWWDFAQKHITGFRFLSLNWFHSTAVTLITGILVIKGKITLGDQLVVGLYLGWLAGPLGGLLGLFQEMRVWLVTVERMRDTLAVRPAVEDRKNARRIKVNGHIVFENVSFKYEDELVIDNVSLEIPAGSSVGIVGPSGAGKSTLLSLLLRLYDPLKGRVLVDGHDLKDVRVADYHHQIGPVLQDTFLFQGSLRTNMQFARPKASDEEIMDALERAEVADFVRQLPTGLDADLSEGARVSGGQRQRIGIARAIIRNPNMMILDEPTSSLDIPTETAIVKTLRSVIKGRTAFFVSHRLGLVMGCDMIVVMDKGKVVAKGTHAELLEGSALYKDLWNEQYGNGAAANGDAQAV